MTTLFNQETPALNQQTESNQSTQTPPNDPLNTLLGSIKNERGEQKYRTVEEALKGLQHAQGYIPELRSELNAFKAQFEDVQTKLKKQEEIERLVNDVATRQTKVQETPAQAFDESKLAELVDSRLTANEQARIAHLNQTSVRDSIVKTYGDKAAEIFNAKASDFGMSPEELTALAARSPKAVLSMLGVTGTDAHKQSTQAPSSSSLNSAVIANTRNSLLGDRQLFTLKAGATDSDVKAMAQRSSDLMQELQDRDGVDIHDLTNPATYFKYFGN